MGHILTHPSSEPRGTTDKTIVRDLRASLAVRRGAKSGETFGDFLAGVRSLGVTDDMPLSMIEFGVSQLGNGYITVDTNENGIEIREGR